MKRLIHSALKALALSIPTYLGVVGLFPFTFWVWLHLAILSALYSLQVSALCLLIAIGSLLAGLLWYVILIFVYSLLLKLLWSNPPQLIKPPRKWGILSNFGVSSLAMLPVSLIYVVHVWGKVLLESTNVYNLYRTYPIEEVIVGNYWLWLLFACYLLHQSQESHLKSQHKKRSPIENDR